MTQAVQIPHAVFLGTGSGTTGPFQLRDGAGNSINIGHRDYLKVFRYNAAEQIIGTPEAYVINGTPDAASFTIATPLITGQYILAYRQTPIEQALNLVPYANYDVSDIMRGGLDPIVRMLQEIMSRLQGLPNIRSLAGVDTPGPTPLEAIIGKIPFIGGTPDAPILMTIDGAEGFAMSPAIEAALAEIRAVYLDITGPDTIGVVAADLLGDRDIPAVADGMANINRIAGELDDPTSPLNSTTSADINSLNMRVTRLETFHAPVMPEFQPVPTQTILAGTSGSVDLATYLDDPDSTVFIWDDTGLPNADFSRANGILSWVTPSVLASTPVTITATDEAALTASVTFNVVVYSGAPPTIPPSFLALNPVSVVTGNPIPAFDYKTRVNDPDTATTSLSFARSGHGASGYTISASGIQGGTAGPQGTYTITLTATDPEGNSDSESFTLTVLPAPSPVWSAVPDDGVLQYTAGISVPLGMYVSDANTSLPELLAAVTHSGGPAGTTYDSNTGHLGLPSHIDGTFNVTVTTTNRAGLSASDTFVYIVTPDAGSGGGGGGGGTGESWDRNLV